MSMSAHKLAWVKLRKFSWLLGSTIRGETWVERGTQQGMGNSTWPCPPPISSASASAAGSWQLPAEVRTTASLRQASNTDRRYDRRECGRLTPWLSRQGIEFPPSRRLHVAWFAEIHMPWNCRR